MFNDPSFNYIKQACEDYDFCVEKTPQAVKEKLYTIKNTVDQLRQIAEKRNLEDFTYMASGIRSNLRTVTEWAHELRVLEKETFDSYDAHLVFSKKKAWSNNNKYSLIENALGPVIGIINDLIGFS